MGEPKDDDPFADWNDDAGGVVDKPDKPADAELLLSRTQTVADPLTTELLAEVARRTATMEFEPATLADARPTQEIDPEVLRRALAEAEADPRRKAK